MPPTVAPTPSPPSAARIGPAAMQRAEQRGSEASHPASQPTAPPTIPPAPAAPPRRPRAPWYWANGRSHACVAYRSVEDRYVVLDETVAAKIADDPRGLADVVARQKAALGHESILLPAPHDAPRDYVRRKQGSCLRKRVPEHFASPRRCCVSTSYTRGAARRTGVSGAKSISGYPQTIAARRHAPCDIFPETRTRSVSVGGPCDGVRRSIVRSQRLAGNL
jgi:hypothetical protein